MRWGIFFTVILLLGSCSNSTSENPKTPATTNDSIQIWANQAKNNTELPLQSRKKLIQRAYRANLAISNASTKVKNLSRISLAYLELRDTVNFRKTNTQLIELANQINDNIAQGEGHWDLGNYFSRIQPDSAFYHFYQAHSLFKTVDYQIPDFIDKADYPGRMLKAMASVRDDIKDHVGAEKDAIAAITEFKRIDAKDRLYGAYNVLANSQNGLNKFEKALEYQNKAKEYIRFKPKEKQNRYYRTNLNNIASIYLRSKEYAKAFQLYNQIYEQSQNINNDQLLIEFAYGSLAISGFKSNNLNLEEATTLIETSNKGLDSLGDTYQKSRNQQFLAEILIAANQPQEAVKYAKEARDIAQATKNNDRLLEILKLLSQIDDANSSQHSRAYFQLSEELINQERAIQDKFGLIEFITEEVKEENESLAKRNELLGGIAIGLLVLGIGVFTIISQRISNQRLKFKQKEQTKNQEIYNLMLSQHGKMEEGKKSEQKRVSEELHDGILGQLLGIRLILSGLNERSDEAAMEQRGELIVKLQEVEEEIRTISHELNASAYKKMHNFILSIADLIASVKKSSSLDIDFQYQNEFQWDSLHSDIKINSYRIIQELLQNSVKHAQCKNVRVVFIKDKNSLNLTVQDDGVGFDDSKVKKGIGLKNITSRVKKIGAQVNVKSQPLQGTTVTITIPNIDLKRQHPKPNNKRNSVVET